MDIRQLSVTYLAEQDRILVRINTTQDEEMRMWFTRRLLLGLWPLLSRLMTEHLLRLEAAGTSLVSADEELKRMLADFRKEEFLQHADFDTPYQENQPNLPLGEEPLLVTDVDAAPTQEGPLRLSFNERPPGAQTRSFQMEMEPRLMQGLMHLLEQALSQSQWREPFEAAAAAVDEALGGDEEGRPSRPRYLN